MDRLTLRDEDGELYISTENQSPPYPIVTYEALEKLAHYEDLAEAGRLMILPKDYDMEKLKKEHCPFFLGFEECDERCVDYADCDECWEAALKDGESE